MKNIPGIDLTARNFPDAVLDEVIAGLKGTCNTLDQVCASLGFEDSDLGIADLGYIESEIFLCTGCGWWCENCEMHLGPFEDEPLCENCHDEVAV